MQVAHIEFPSYIGLRCLMMPYIQGESSSVPQLYSGYADILDSTYIHKGDIGFLTIDESPVTAGQSHRGQRAKFGRALHTEVGKVDDVYCWGGGGWGGRVNVLLDANTQILLSNNISGSCAIWDAIHSDTSADGDIGDKAEQYPYTDATLLQAGDVHQIGIFTPHESVPIQQPVNRQFLRIVGSGVYGREEYFTTNPLLQ